MGTILQKLNKLKETKDAIRLAIVGKGQSLAANAPFSSYPGKIAAITTGIDTSDANAAGSDILSGKTAYVKGAKVTGTIASKGANDLTASGSSVSVPAGYYPSAVSKSVATIQLGSISISINSSGLITASIEQSGGYVSGETKSATKQLTTQAAKTVTPSTSKQTAVAAGVYTTGAVEVAAMPTATQATPSITVDSAGKITASATQEAGYVAAGTKSATQQLTTVAAQTITPGTAAKTAVASGRYTTGAVKVAGDANLKAANIKEGVSIFGVIGSYAGSVSGASSNVTIKKNLAIKVLSVIYPSSESEISETEGGTLGADFTTFGAFYLSASTNAGSLSSLDSSGDIQAVQSISVTVSGGTYMNISTGSTISLRCLILPTSPSVTVTITVGSGSGTTI